jgi:copper transport protein
MRVQLSALLLVLSQMTAAAAFAQAALTETMPSDDAVLQHAPSNFTLRFDKVVKSVAFKLLLPDGSTLPLQVQPVQNRPESLHVSLPLSTTPGTYLLSWRVASSDGKPSGGALTYSLGYRSDICVVNPGTGAGSVSLGPPERYSGKAVRSAHAAQRNPARSD